MSLRTTDSDAHGVRPTDLPALVSFDEDVYENHAYTRERLAEPDEAPRPLAAAIEDWLGLGRRAWIDVRGRQIEGIATARALSRRVWLIDTLIDAAPGDAGAAVLGALLRKAQEAAREDLATHLLLRTRIDSPAVAAALHRGFKPVQAESAWRGRLRPGSAHAEGTVLVRRAEERDEMPRFQLFNQTLPLDAREAVALTLEEWQETRERRWLLRGGTEWVAVVDDRVAGVLQLSSSRSAPQLDVTVDASREDVAAALLDRAGTVLAERRGSRQVLALARSGGGIERTLADQGLERVEEYMLLCLRLARPVRASQLAGAGLVVPTRG